MCLLAHVSFCFFFFSFLVLYNIKFWCWKHIMPCIFMFKDEFSTERKVHLINCQVYVTQSVYEHVCRRLYDKYICIHGIYLLMQARCDLIHFPALLTDAFCSFTYAIVLLKKSSIEKKTYWVLFFFSSFFRALSLSDARFFFSHYC